MAKDNPIKGPFPDGDSRNITLRESDSPIEPSRTGPREPENREEGAPASVIGNLPTHKIASSPDAISQETSRAAGTAPQSAELGFGGVSGAVLGATLGMADDPGPARIHADEARPLGKD